MAGYGKPGDNDGPGQSDFTERRMKSENDRKVYRRPRCIEGRDNAGASQKGAIGIEVAQRFAGDPSRPFNRAMNDDANN